MLVSEHRRSYTSSLEMPDIIHERPDITLYASSASRWNAVDAEKILRAEGIQANVVHLYWLKPFDLTERIIQPLLKSRCGLVVDSTYETSSVARSNAYTLMLETGFPVQSLGQFDRTQGVAKHLENGSPLPERIAENARALIKKKTRWSYGAK